MRLTQSAGRREFAFCGNNNTLPARHVKPGQSPTVLHAARVNPTLPPIPVGAAHPAAGHPLHPSVDPAPGQLAHRLLRVADSSSEPHAADVWRQSIGDWPAA